LADLDPRIAPRLLSDRPPRRVPAQPGEESPGGDNARFALPDAGEADGVVALLAAHRERQIVAIVEEIGVGAAEGERAHDDIEFDPAVLGFVLHLLDELRALALGPGFDRGEQ